MGSNVKFLIIFLAFFGASQFAYAQSSHKIDQEVLVFQDKLQKYFSKHARASDSKMPVKKLDSADSQMPTGNIQSLMIDKEIGLAFEFSTKKIFDQSTDLVYDIKSGMIYDPEKDEFYHYEIPDGEYLYYRDVTPQSIIGFHHPDKE